MTADNASNNGTMMKRLSQLWNRTASHPAGFDAQEATLRCLCHIIHLAIMQFLVVLGAVKESEARDGELDLAMDLSEADAEKLGDDKEVEALGKLTNEQIIAQKGGDASESGPWVIRKVRDIDVVTLVFLLLTSDVHLKIRGLVKLVRSSTQRSEDFKSAIDSANSKINRDNENAAPSEKEPTLSYLALILDVVTRWNSTFFMLERAYRLRKVSSYCPHSLRN